jgi:hypothetical protein
MLLEGARLDAVNANVRELLVGQVEHNIIGILTALYVASFGVHLQT